MGYRILIVTSLFPNAFGDREGNFIYYSAKALTEAGNSVYVLVVRSWLRKIFETLCKGRRYQQVNADIFSELELVKEVGCFNIPRYFFLNVSRFLLKLRLKRMMYEIVKTRNIDIISVHGLNIGHVVLSLSRKIDVPVILTIHGIDTSDRLLNTANKRKICTSTLKNVNRVILVGDVLKSYFAMLCKDTNNFRVIPNGYYLPESLRSCAGRKFRGKLRFISISNLHREKGIDLNLKALASLDNEGVYDWEYQIIGDGNERKRLERLRGELGLDKKIYFYGYLSHTDALRHLEKSNIFILPSYREAFGIAYLEAMAAGLLAVGVEGQGSSAFIKNGITGYLIPPQNVDALCCIFRCIKDNPDEAARIAAAGRKIVQKEFTWEKHARKLMSLYSEILEKLK